MAGLANLKRKKEKKMKRRKGFTLVELLVVIAIIALLMGILMPALARVRSIAYRLVCGTNLSGIGKAMVLYANDWEEDYPTAGPRSVYWEKNHEIAVWDSDVDGEDAYGTGSNVGTTVTSCLYLLVKGYDLPPKQFVCRGDVGTNAFEFNIDGTSATDPTETDFELEDAWDLGGKGSATQPGEYCSYSYHYPFTIFGKSISIASQPSAPLGADRNPWLDKNAGAHLTDDNVARAVYRRDKYMDTDNRENSASHGFDGQNVLYNDIHVGFEKHPNVGIQLDNIWKRWPNAPIDQAPTDEERQLDGLVPIEVGTSNDSDGSQDQKDSYLINEVQTDWISEAQD